MKKINQMKSFDAFFAEQMKDPEFKKEYDLREPERAIMRAFIENRIKGEVSQAELAERMGTKQSAISRFESGRTNPTMDFMSRLARALGLEIRVVKLKA